MRKLFGLIGITLLLAACGKNDNFRNQGYVPYNNGYGQMGPTVPYAPYTAPMAPPAYTGNPYGGYRPPVQWQVPQGQPPQFQPFAPMYNYMQQQGAQMQQYWQYMWYQWSMFAMQRQMYLYDFQGFWGQFCPQFWGGSSSYQQVYSWFDYNVYSPSGYGYCSNCW